MSEQKPCPDCGAEVAQCEPCYYYGVITTRWRCGSHNTLRSSTCYENELKALRVAVRLAREALECADYELRDVSKDSARYVRNAIADALTQMQASKEDA